jgi:hypothetical protein
MSTLTQIEQTTPTTPAPGAQVIYPKLGSYARLDSGGVEHILLDTTTYAAAMVAVQMQVNFWGV